jgi:hypothetical protein
MKAFKELEVKLHSFLTLAVEGDNFITGISEYQVLRVVIKYYCL